MHARVPGVVASSVVVHLRSVSTEHTLHRLQALDAQLVTVAQEERSLELARVGDPLQQVTRNESLPRSCGKRQERARLSALRRTLGDLLQYRADGRVLEIAPLAFAAHVARQKGFG